MLKNLFQLFDIQEFVVDEHPLTVLRRTRFKPAVEADAADPAAGTPVKASAGEEETDLRTQMAELLMEQVRLAEKARHLEKTRASDDEFGRFVRQAMPFLDNFHHLLELARENPPSEEVDNWLKSVEALYFRIVSLFESYGLVFINSLGKQVDLNYHEVIDYRPSTEQPHDTVVRELQKGVVFRGRLLRDAKVIVAYNP